MSTGDSTDRTHNPKPSTWYFHMQIGPHMGTGLHPRLQFTIGIKSRPMAHRLFNMMKRLVDWTLAAMLKEEENTK